MRRRPSTDLVLGCGCVAFAALLILVWIPLDTETPIIERVRGRQVIGDAMAPTVVALVLGAAGVMLMVEGWRRASTFTVTRDNLIYLAKLLAIILVAMLLMRWVGPFTIGAAQWLGFEGASYRELRDTVPWKYLGYMAGGSFLICSLVTFIERRLRWRTLAIALGATVLVAALYDVPFNTLILPPNGDV